ncbi:organoarsenical effux MFS transporter ArsJ [Aliikangiella sp. IMCC44632]
MLKVKNLSQAIKQYALITANYWCFTLTDGALRMLVVLYFHQLGYSPLAVASLFLFYELFGVITNLLGGWLASKTGLNRTMHLGLLLQISALLLLAVPSEQLTVIWVMFAQAISGVAKDLNKMSAKSSIKFLVKNGDQQLFRWVAMLTGSKNTLKGCGFFLGGALLAILGFQYAVLSMAVGLSIMLLISSLYLHDDLGASRFKPKFTQIFAKSKAINLLSAARLFLFGARDIWFVIALPVFLSQSLGWSHPQVSGLFAVWIIGYGAIQSLTPQILNKRFSLGPSFTQPVNAFYPALALCLIPAIMSVLLYIDYYPLLALFLGLALFAFLFAVNSAIHSYLIVAYASKDSVSLDVGFYYMANAAGRLIGTLLSGLIFQSYGLAACLLVSAIFILVSAGLARGLPNQPAT